jgi:hypothetical protein
MKDKIEQRFSDLQKEYEAGQKMLAELEMKQTQVRQTLLRIEGALQVLKELAESPQAPAP